MGIIVSAETKAIVQGITGSQGTFHTKLMLDYGTQIVAGTSPGKGGGTVFGVPVYDTVKEAVEKNVANASIVFVPAPFALDAALEAVEAELKTVVVITENVPVKDVIDLISYARYKGTTIVGPNTPGVITPGKSKLGILPSKEFVEGNVGVASRSGTLTYEIAASLTKIGIGQSTCIGLGGDPITGLNFIDALEMFKNDPQTSAVVLIGEIGGNIEELTAEYISKNHYEKPVVAFIAGRNAPLGKKMGHAGAIVMGNSGTAETKIAAFEKAGVKVAEKPSDVAKLLSRIRREVGGQNSGQAEAKGISERFTSEC